jgi:peptidoglycan/LPS O-acetylase OafA/YrhL
LRRIDVDGLRAISIIALTLYNWKYLPGGKYAVDVFFVVSGYIISQNIFQ